MNKLLILSSGSFFSQQLAEAAETCGIDVCMLTELEAYRSSWHVTTQPQKMVQIDTSHNRYQFSSKDIFYDELSWRLSPGLRGLYRDGTYYHQHAWQAFFMGLYKLMKPLLPYKSEHWSSYFWLWRSMMYHARQVGLSTIDQHDDFDLQRVRTNSLYPYYWRSVFQSSGVLFGVQKVGRCWFENEVSGSIAKQLTKSTQDKLEAMAKQLGLPAAEWVLLYDSKCDGWYVCSCSRWIAGDIRPNDLDSLLKSMLSDMGKSWQCDRLPACISSHLRPNISLPIKTDRECTKMINN